MRRPLTCGGRHDRLVMKLLRTVGSSLCTGAGMMYHRLDSSMWNYFMPVALVLDHYWDAGGYQIPILKEVDCTSRSHASWRPKED